jgi:ABC-type transporter lipoprotein component MlaA
MELKPIVLHRECLSLWAKSAKHGLFLAALLSWTAGGSFAADADALSTNAAGPAVVDAGAQTVVLPPSVPDPAEPMNRAFWKINEALLTDAVQPSGNAYRRVVIRPFRRGIGNFGRNAL